jgi:hypothetical protein
MRTLASALLLSCLIAQRATAAGTWPAHLYDNARTGSSPEHLQTPLELEWVHRSAHAIHGRPALERLHRRPGPVRAGCRPCRRAGW